MPFSTSQHRAIGFLLHWLSWDYMHTSHKLFSPGLNACVLLSSLVLNSTRSWPLPPRPPIWGSLNKLSPRSTTSEFLTLRQYLQNGVVSRLLMQFSKVSSSIHPAFPFRLLCLLTSFSVIGERVVTPSSIVFLVVKLRISPPLSNVVQEKTLDVNEAKRRVKLNDEKDEGFLNSRKEAEELPPDNQLPGWVHAPYWPGVCNSALPVFLFLF